MYKRIAIAFGESKLKKNYSESNKTSINFQRHAHARKGIDHAQHTDRAACRDRIVHKFQRPLMVRRHVVAQGSALPDAVFAIQVPGSRGETPRTKLSRPHSRRQIWASQAAAAITAFW
jgi:hypothetical protein